MYPKVNQNIIIDLLAHEQVCRSIIAEVEDQDILIGYPLDRNLIGLLMVGTEIDIFFMEGENQYKFRSEILGKENGHIPLCRIKKPSEEDIIKIQRRDNFRVNSNLNLMINNNKFHTINISGGGMLFTCGMNLHLHEEEEISGTLLIPTFQDKESQLISFKGEIIRISSIKNSDSKNVAVNFTELSKQDQMKIVQHCFEKQRQMRLKAK